MRKYLLILITAILAHEQAQARFRIEPGIHIGFALGEGFFLQPYVTAGIVTSGGPRYSEHFSARAGANVQVSDRSSHFLLGLAVGTYRLYVPLEIGLGIASKADTRYGATHAYLDIGGIGNATIQVINKTRGKRGTHTVLVGGGIAYPVIHSGRNGIDYPVPLQFQ
jgi:hypothetical protein